MRSLLCLTCVFLLNLVPAAAQPAASVSRSSCVSPPPAQPAATTSRLLLFHVDPGLPNGTPHVLDFRVTVGGQPYLTETLVLPQMQEDASFELLAREPERLARLYSLAAAGAVAIAIRLDDHPLRTFSFQDFVAYNRVIRHGNLRPRVAASTVAVLAADPVFSTTGVPVNAPAMELPASRPFAGGPNASDECLDNCAYAFQSCMDTQCSGLKQCEKCDQQYEVCSDPAEDQSPESSEFDAAW